LALAAGVVIVQVVGRVLVEELVVVLVLVEEERVVGRVLVEEVQVVEELVLEAQVVEDQVVEVPAQHLFRVLNYGKSPAISSRIIKSVGTIF